MPEKKATTPPGSFAWERWLALALLLSLLLGAYFAGKTFRAPERELDSYVPWEKDTLAAARELPVQAGGRVKPLETYAAFFMLGMRGDRSIRIEGGIADPSVRKHVPGGKQIVKITPTAFLLDCFFRPELAKSLPAFRVDDSGILQSLGLKAGSRRSRFSYLELKPALPEVFRLGIEYEAARKRGFKLGASQKQLLDLAVSVRTFEAHTRFLSLARFSRIIGSEEMRWSRILGSREKIGADLRRHSSQASSLNKEARFLLSCLVGQSRHGRHGPSFFPPEDSASEVWLTPGARLWNALMEPEIPSELASSDIALLEKIDHAIRHGNAKEQAAAWQALSESVSSRMPPVHRRELRIENFYNRMKPFYHGLFLFIPALVLGLLSLLFRSPRLLRLLRAGIWLFSLGGLALVTAGIVQRCLITHRPPVGNLFETIPFITATGVALFLILELFSRRGFALGLAPVLGLAGLILARLFEQGDASDSLTPLGAVLLSNFWLTTHVITITLGYAAGLVAGLISHAYLILRFMRPRFPDASLRHSLTRMVYGVICFTLLLSLVGTITGGIWANESWGRFWGWDPKENGALMIVLFYLFILHARLGGIIREWGLHLCAVLGNTVIVFSWWGVNMLGTGLHSYGSTEGSGYVKLFYLLEFLLFLLGCAYAFLDKRKKDRKSTRLNSSH